jgi:hypothetical protein
MHGYMEKKKIYIDIYMLLFKLSDISRGEVFATRNLFC